MKKNLSPKKTTDDCYTPKAVYDVIKDWVLQEYGIEEDRPIIRPFYPGGDYERYNYPPGCVVIDNPPFSILAKILDFYNASGIDYFLFAPTLTLFSGERHLTRYIVNGNQITYENGAKVNTSFVTNMGEYKIRVVPELSRRISEAQRRDKSETELDYPPNVTTAARLGKLSKGAAELKIKPEQCVFIRSLDSQKEAGAALFGGGYLISDGAAAARERAETLAEAAKISRLTAIANAGGIYSTGNNRMTWALSDRERDIIARLNQYDE